MTTPSAPTTSGTANYNPAAVKIITRAMRIMAVIDDSEDPTAEQMSDGMDGLNTLMKELEATGLHVWTEEEAILFLQQNQVRYLLGSPVGGTSTPDHCADANSWELTSLELAVVAGATSVVVNDPTGINKGDYFGIVLDAGNAFWTTVKTQPTNTTIALVDAVTGSAQANNTVFAYETNIVRPLQVPFARRLQYQTGSQLGGIITPLAPMMSRQDYFNLPQPKTPGTVTQAYYNPARDQGEIYVWNAPQNANNGLRFTWYRPLQDFTSTGNVADLPQEWNSALIWNLAEELKLDYSVSEARAATIKEKAAIKLDLVRGYDREFTSVYFGRASSQLRGGG